MAGGILNNLINIIYPAQCLACKNPTASQVIVCQDCLKQIEKNLPPFCPRCGRNFKNNKCLHCGRLNFYFNRAWSACSYTRTSRELIHLFKYQGKVKLKKILTEILVNFIRNFHLPMDKIEVITPIPLYRARLREREFNQAELLSASVAEEFKIRHSSQNLIRRLNNTAQAKLNADLRFKNIQGAFVIKSKDEFHKKNVLLIDDVLTTGATCSEAAGTLKEAGAKDVFVLTFAS